MKKNTRDMLLHLLVSIIICFVVIYVFIFFGGWRLVESGNVVVLEFVAALALGFVFWIMYEITRSMEAKIKELEARIEALEKDN